MLLPDFWNVCHDSAGPNAYERLDPADFFANDLGILPGDRLVVDPGTTGYFAQDPSTGEFLIFYNGTEPGHYPVSYWVVRGEEVYGPGIFNVYLWDPPHAEPDTITLTLPVGYVGAYDFSLPASVLSANDTYAGPDPNPRLAIAYPCVTLEPSEDFTIHYNPLTCPDGFTFRYFISEHLYCTSNDALVTVRVQEASAPGRK